MEFIDFTTEEFKNDTARSRFAKKAVSEAVFSAMKNTVEPDRIVFIPEEMSTEKGVEFSAGDTALVVGKVLNKEGFEVDVIAEISVKIKYWNDTDGKRPRHAVCMDDILEVLNAEDGAE